MTFLSRSRKEASPKLRCLPQVRGHSLVIDCASCAGEGSLGDVRCLQEFLSKAPSHSEFVHIMLRRQVEVRYQPAASHLLIGAAELIREIDSIHPSKRRSCSRCDFRPGAVARRVILSKWGYHLSTRRRPRGKRCGSCAGLSADLVREVEDRLQDLESKSLVEAMISKDG